MEIPDPQNISVRPETVDISKLKINKNECRENSYDVAKENKNIELVEGVILVIDDTDNAIALAHFWNKIDEDHFDVTREMIADSEEGKETKDVKYFITKVHKHTQFKNRNSIKFSKKTRDLALALNNYLKEN